MRRRLISLVLCVACLLPICRPMEAHAIIGVDDAIVAAYGAQLIASVLVASGVVFVVSGAANDVGRHIYDTMASNDTFKSTFKTISGLAAWFLAHPSDISGAALNISDKVASEVIRCFQSRVDGSSYVFDSSVSSSSFRFSSASDLSSFLPTRSFPFYVYYDQGDVTRVFFCDFKPADTGYYFVSDDQLLGVALNTEPKFYNWPDGKTLYNWRVEGLHSSYSWYDYEILVRFTDGSTRTYEPITFYSKMFPGSIVSAPASSVSVRADSVSAPVQRLVVAPSVPSVAASGDVVYSDTVYAAEAVSVPYPLDDDGATITDIPVDVPVSISTGKALADEGEVVVPGDPSKPIEGTGVLSWLQSILKGLLDKIVELLTAIRDGILSIPDLIVKAIAAIFVPSDTAVADVRAAIAARLPVIADVRGVLDNLVDLLQDPTHASSALDLTTVVDFGKHSSGSWGEAKVNLLDASWFLRYKSLTDDIIVGLAWLVFLWRLYGALPNIIHGLGGGAVNDY